jgi:hypothetical protein
VWFAIPSLYETFIHYTSPVLPAHKDKSTKGSVRGKRLQAAWDDNFLWLLLAEGKS